MRYRDIVEEVERIFSTSLTARERALVEFVYNMLKTENALGSEDEDYGDDDDVYSEITNDCFYIAPEVPRVVYRISVPQIEVPYIDIPPKDIEVLGDDEETAVLTWYKSNGLADLELAKKPDGWYVGKFKITVEKLVPNN